MRSRSPSSPSSLAEHTGGLLTAFGSPFTQHGRLFTMAFAEDSGIASDLLLPWHLRGLEKVSGTFFYMIEALSPSAYLHPTQFIGQPVQLAILRDDGGERLVCGVVTSFGQLSSDGGSARYALHVEPCLALFAQTFNARVRQDLRVDEAIREVLDHHIQNNPIVGRAFEVEFRLARALPMLSSTTQCESDLQYVERLMAQYGLFYFFEFRDDGGHPVHALVIADDAAHLRTGAKPILRFSGANADDDTVTQWSGMRRIQPGMVSLTSYEYKSVAVDRASAQSGVDQGEAGNQLASTLHDFDPQSHYYARGGDDLQRHARLRQDAYDFQAQRHTGITSVRGAAPGTAFELRGHPVHDQEDPRQRSFVIVSLVSEARNNLAQETEAAMQRMLQARAPIPAALEPWFGSGRALLDDPRRQPYGNVIECVQRDAPIRMPYAHTRHARPPAPPALTATVIGPEGEEVHTDDQGRVQIEYHFEAHVDNLAPGCVGKTPFRCWVRVMSLAAGSRWGSQIIPRIGMEVLVLFLNGSWERMVCVGALPNGTHPAPHFSGAGSLPANRAQSGFKSKEHHGSGSNQWLMDDTTGQLCMQLLSTHAHTRLAMGWLGTDRRDGKSDPRGEGIELVTQAAAALRSLGPLLLSTEPVQPGGKQLKREMLMQALSAALAAADALGEVAAQLGANQPETGHGNKLVDDDSKAGAQADAGHQAHLKDAVDNLERGYNNDPDGKTGAGGQRGGQGIVAMSSVDGTAIASNKSITLAAGTNLDQVAQRDLNQTSGRRWIHNARESVSLFVDGTRAKIADTFKIIAARGNVKVQAQDGRIEATALKDIEIASVDGKVVIKAPQEILLMAGGGFIRIGKNIEIHNPGSQSQKAAGFALSGPASKNPILPVLPQKEPKPTDLIIHHKYHDEEGIQGAKFAAKLADGSVRQGFADASGTARLENVPPGPVSIRFKPDARKYEVIQHEENPDHKPAMSKTDLDELFAKWSNA